MWLSVSQTKTAQLDPSDSHTVFELAWQKHPAVIQRRKSGGRLQKILLFFFGEKRIIRGTIFPLVSRRF
jgi:hypothetical protein